MHTPPPLSFQADFGIGFLIILPFSLLMLSDYMAWWSHTIVRQSVRFQAAVHCSLFFSLFFLRALNAQIFLFFRPCPVSSFLSKGASFPPAVWVGWAYQVILQHNLTFLPVMCKLPIRLITIKLDNTSQTWAIQSILRNIFQTKRQ